MIAWIPYGAQYVVSPPSARLECAVKKDIFKSSMAPNASGINFHLDIMDFIFFVKPKKSSFYG